MTIKVGCCGFPRRKAEYGAVRHRDRTGSAGAPPPSAWLREYMGSIAPFWAALLFAVVTAALITRV